MHAKVVKIRAKIKDQQKGKQSNKQSLVQPDKVIPSGVWCVRKVFGFNHKIMINVQESPPSIMVTRNLWSARV
jgi:hypothetical protein